MTVNSQRRAAGLKEWDAPRSGLFGINGPDLGALVGLWLLVTSAVAAGWLIARRLSR